MSARTSRRAGDIGQPDEATDRHLEVSVAGPPAENVRRGVRLTRQTGQVLTPTANPLDNEVAFLSDSGGHANLWLVNTQSGALRQITHERDPAVAMGVPVWSPDGRTIAFVSSRGNQG
jgi:Tol biopolymer transport system component